MTTYETETYFNVRYLKRSGVGARVRNGSLNGIIAAGRVWRRPLVCGTYCSASLISYILRSAYETVRLVEQIPDKATI
ncbi:hypothetical protein EVAR_35372_1 [Eumeta japonica]|uniref:Uncharacterized protein n=1 Tax=Eumeta variegata TaxID=151549 RepID=A0A4C2A5X7_EUMVA|nr:hypothetical protein EVAR_35372_1 [Eumeta japonica]